MKNKVTMYSLDADGKSVKQEYTIIDSVTCDLEELLKDMSTDGKEGQTDEKVL